MRTKTRAAVDVKPGMVVRTGGRDTYGLDLSLFRQVDRVEKNSYYFSVAIFFTDGRWASVDYGRTFQVARSKAQRTAARARAAANPARLNAEQQALWDRILRGEVPSYPFTPAP